MFAFAHLDASATEGAARRPVRPRRHADRVAQLFRLELHLHLIAALLRLRPVALVQDVDDVRGHVDDACNTET